MSSRRVIASAIGAALFAALLSGCGEEEEKVEINASTEQQEQIAQARADDPRINIPDAPGEWGEDQSGELIKDAAQGNWLEFSSDSYDFDAVQYPTMMRMWVLRAPDGDGDGRTGAVFVTAAMRPFMFTDAGSGQAWGNTNTSAIAALKEEAELSPSDISQDEAVTLGDHEAHLISGYAVNGPNADRNFAYVLMDDGHFFYEFRLAGDPRYFPDYQAQFLDYVASVTFDK